MTLTELRYILAVAEHRHFGHAAEACFVSQPTLSIGIRKLEEELGVRLFERSRSDVIITPVGEILLEKAARVISAADDFKLAAEAEQDPLGKELRLGVIYTIGPYLIPRFIGEMKKLAPELSLVLRENFTDVLAAALKRGDLDAAVMSLPFDDPQLRHQALYEEPFQVALPNDHPLAKRKRLRAEDLSEQTMLLLGAKNCFREQVVAACPSCAPGAAGDLQQTLEGSSLDTICQMVATGAGVTVLPVTTRISDDLSPLLALRPFVKPQPSRTVAVFYRREFARPAVINCIAEAVRSAKLPNVNYLKR